MNIRNYEGKITNLMNVVNKTLLEFKDKEMGVHNKFKLIAKKLLNDLKMNENFTKSESGKKIQTTYESAKAIIEVEETIKTGMENLEKILGGKDVEYVYTYCIDNTSSFEITSTMGNNNDINSDQN